MDTRDDTVQYGCNASSAANPDPNDLVKPDPCIRTFYVIIVGDPVGIIMDIWSVIYLFFFAELF